MFKKARYIPYLKKFIALLICMNVLLILIPTLISCIIPDKTHIDKSGNAENSCNKVELPKTVTVYRTETGTVDKLPFEEYVKGVVSCEMPAAFHLEALKAQAVAARTYSAAKVINSDSSGNPSKHPDAPLCDSTHCQVFKSEKELKKLKGDEWMKKDYLKICSAVDDTAGELLYYKGDLVQQALFHSSSGGATENCEDVFTAAVPYLVSVESPYEDAATHRNEKTTFSIDEFSSIIKSAYPDIYFGQITPNNIKILNRSSGNRVDNMQIGYGTLTGREVREALGLSSANFTVDISDGNIYFTSNGSGHGVGMSQYGADGMAREGYDYKKILSHYYSGTELY